MAKANLKATCSVCFREHKLLASGRRPVRHGFSIVTNGLGHGHIGAWHTSSCPGGRFPHFGISTEGTEWALARTRETLEERLAWQEKLNSDDKPGLRWAPSKLQARYGAKSVVVRPGSTAVKVTFPKGGGQYTIPDYDKLFARAAVEVEQQIKLCQSHIAHYENAIKSWKPAEAVVVETKIDATPRHKRASWKNRGSLDAPFCKAFSMRPPTGAQLYAESDDQVTCKACLKAMEREANAKAKREAEKAANHTYRVTFPDGSTRETTNDRQGTKRPLIKAVIYQAHDRWHVDWCVSDGVAKKAVREVKGWAQNVQIVPVEDVTA